MLLLTIDVGNTNADFVWFENKQKFTRTEIANTDLADAEKLAAAFAFGPVPDATALGTVVPAAGEAIRRFVAHEMPAMNMMTAGYELPVPVENTCDNPHTVGVDRLLNVCAAYHIYNKAAMVVDLGTALTIDVVDDKKRFLGGIIAPGMGMSTRALKRYTAQLPQVEIVFPRPVLGNNTVQAIQSGISWGCVGMVDYLVELLIAEVGECPIIGTGGEIEMISEHSKYVKEVYPDLTNMGLRVSYEYWVKSG